MYCQYVLYYRHFSVRQLTLEAHKSRATDSRWRNLSNVEQSCHSELADAETHHNAANDNDRFVVGVCDLRNAAEKDTERGNPEDHFATPSVVDRTCNQCPKKVADIDGGGC